MKKLKNKLTKFFMLLIAFSFFIVPTQAHDAYSFITLIDNQTISYRGYVIFDEKTSTNDPTKHLEVQLGDFDKIKDADNFFKNIDYEDLAVFTELDPSSYSHELVFGFPSKNIQSSIVSDILKDSTIFISKLLAEYNDASGADQARAYLVKDTLIQNLNQALYFINHNKNFISVEGLMVAAEELAKGGTTSTGYTVNYIDNYTCQITSPEGDMVEFTYGIDKGYTQETLDGVPNQLYKKEYKGTLEVLNWKHVIAQANYAYIVAGHSVSTVSLLKEENWITSAVTWVISGLLDGARSNLGMWEIDDLFFNKNLRANERMYVEGAITRDRYESSFTYHQILQIVALSMLQIAVTYLIFQYMRSASYMARMSVCESIPRLILTVILMGSSYQICLLMLKCNSMIVDIFGATQVMPFKNYAYAAGAIENVLMEFYYFFISMYFNILYVSREFLLLVLIAAAPIFFVTMAFDKRCTLVRKWISLMIYTIFMQSVHVFVLSILLPNIATGRGIEQAVGYFLLIPITTAFKTTLLGKEGAFLGTLSGAGTAMAASVPLMVGAGTVTGFAGIANGKNNMRGNEKYNSINTSTVANGRNANHLKILEKPIGAKYSVDGMTKGPSVASRFGSFVSSTPVRTAATAAIQAGSAVPYMAMGLALGGENPNAAKIASVGMTNGLMGAGITVGDGTRQGISNGVEAGKGILHDRNVERYQTSIAKGKQVNSIKGVSEGQNGTMKIQHDRAKLQAVAGIKRVNMSGEKGQHLSVNYGQNAPSDVANIKRQYMKATDSTLSKKEQDLRMTHLREQGIERVGTNDEGDTIVTYNKVGKARMNISSASTSGNSVDVVKQQGQNAETNWHYSVGRRTAETKQASVKGTRVAKAEGRTSRSMLEGNTAANKEKFNADNAPIVRYSKPTRLAEPRREVRNNSRTTRVAKAETRSSVSTSPQNQVNSSNIDTSKVTKGKLVEPPKRKIKVDIDRRGVGATDDTSSII